MELQSINIPKKEGLTIGMIKAVEFGGIDVSDWFNDEDASKAKESKIQNITTPEVKQTTINPIKTTAPATTVGTIGKTPQVSSTVIDGKKQWHIPGDKVASDNFVKNLKKDYADGKYSTHTSFLKSDNPYVEGIKKLHNGNMDEIREHFNNTVGRWQTRPAMKHGSMTGTNLKNATAKHWQVPDLSEAAKKEIDSYGDPKEFHRALVNGDLSKEVTDYLKGYKYHNKNVVDPNDPNEPVGGFFNFKAVDKSNEWGDPDKKEYTVQKWWKYPRSSTLKKFDEMEEQPAASQDEGLKDGEFMHEGEKWKVDKDMGTKISAINIAGNKRKIIDKDAIGGGKPKEEEDNIDENQDNDYDRMKNLIRQEFPIASEQKLSGDVLNTMVKHKLGDLDAPDAGKQHKKYNAGDSVNFNGNDWKVSKDMGNYVIVDDKTKPYGRAIAKNDIEKFPKVEAKVDIHRKDFKNKLLSLGEEDFQEAGYSPEETQKLKDYADFEARDTRNNDNVSSRQKDLKDEYHEMFHPDINKLKEEKGEDYVNSPEFTSKKQGFDKLREELGGDVHSPEFQEKLGKFLDYKKTPEFQSDYQKLKDEYESSKVSSQDMASARKAYDEARSQHLKVGSKDTLKAATEAQKAYRNLQDRESGNMQALKRLNDFKTKSESEHGKKLKDYGISDQDKYKLLGILPELKGTHKQAEMSAEDIGDYENLVNKNKWHLMKKMGYYPEPNIDDIKKHGFFDTERRKNMEMATPEQIYKNLGYPSDHPHKDYLVKKIKEALLREEHSTGKVGRTIESMAGNVQKKVKHFLKSTTPTLLYIGIRKGINFIMELIKREKSSKFEKALETADAADTEYLRRYSAAKILTALSRQQDMVLNKSYFGELAGYPVQDEDQDILSGVDSEIMKSFVEDYGKAKRKTIMLKSLGDNPMIEYSKKYDLDNIAAMLSEDGSIKVVIPELEVE